MRREALGLVVALAALALPASATAAAPWTERYARCPSGAKARTFCPDVYLGDFKRQLRFDLKRAYCPHLPFVPARGAWSFVVSLKVRKGRFRQTYVYDSMLPGFRESPQEWQVTFKLSGTFTRKVLRVAIKGSVTRDNDGLNDCRDVRIDETHVLRRKDF